MYFSLTMAACGASDGVLQQLLGILRDESREKEEKLVSLRTKCKKKKRVLEERRVNSESLLSLCEFARIQLLKDQQLLSAQRCPVR